MRVVYLAAGAANMLCGSCLRDNRLAATLLRQGRDVKLIPLYTPLRSDETLVANDDVYFGGVNVFLQQKYALFRNTPRFVDRWLDRPGVLRFAGRFATQTRPEDLGALTVAMLQGRHGPLQKELDRLIEMLRTLQPALINLPDAMFVGIAPALAEALHVPIVCTLSGEDLFIEGLPDEARRETLRLIGQHSAAVDLFLASSAFYTRHSVGYFGLHPERVRHVPLGLAHDHPPRSQEPPAEPFTLAFVGRIAPEKGLKRAAEALIMLRRQGRNVRLVAGGWVGNRAYLDEVKALVARAGAGDAFDFRGELTREAKYELLTSAHVFTMPSVFPEAKGLPVLEALSLGVPVVQPATGSFPELIEATGGGLLFDPDDPDGLAGGVARLMDDAALRRSLGASGAEAVRAKFTDHGMAEETWRHYAEIIARGRST